MDPAWLSNLADLGMESPDQQGWDDSLPTYDESSNVDADFGLQQQMFGPAENDGLVLRDEASYQTCAAEHLNEQYRNLDPNVISDSDTPTDPSEARVYIKRLFDAFMNTDNVIDKSCKNGKPAQSVQRFQNNYYPKLVIEKACWEIFSNARDAQLGICLVEEHHSPRVESRDVHATFEDRMASIIKGLTFSKAMCKQVLDPSYLHRLCDAPDSELFMKKNNKVINGQRDVQNEMGRKILKKKFTDEDYAKLPDKEEENDDGEENNEEEDGNGAVSSTPAHTPARPRRAARSRATSSAYKTRLSSSTKRKKPTHSSLGDDDDDDGDADYTPSAFVTPARRLVTRRRTAAVAPSPTPRAGTNDDENSGNANASSLLSRRQPGRRSSNAARKTSNRRRSTKGRGSTSSSNPEPSPSDSAARRLTISSNPEPFPQYSDLASRQIICDLLNVHHDFATRYSLTDLRTYARAYNQAYGQQAWVPEGFPDCVGNGHAMWDGRNSYDHFAQCLPQLMNLAIAREDLNHDGTYNANAPFMSGFNTRGNATQDRALGFETNNHGLQHQFHAQIQPRFTGQFDDQFGSQFGSQFDPQPRPFQPMLHRDLQFPPYPQYSHLSPFTE